MSDVGTAGPATSRWPTGTEYSASVQQPTTSFADGELQGSTLTLTPLGLPASASGQNAIAFHFEATDRAVAVRCLLSAHDDGRHRYRALEDHVAAGDIPAVVAAVWHDEGIRVHGRWWPIVVMPWVGGAPLNSALEDRLHDSDRLWRLADRWLDLVENLQEKQFAHGDYQHGNVLLDDDDEFQLIDLDGIWVPEIGVGPPNEYGHPNYQHVNRSDTDWGPNVDTFSALVVALSIMALAVDPALERFMTGESLLFTKADFEDPKNGRIWRVLAKSNDPDVVDLNARVRAYAAAGRPPTISVREALDASFDPDALMADDGPAPAPTGGLPTSGDGSDWWTNSGPSSPVAAQPASSITPRGDASQPPARSPNPPESSARESAPRQFTAQAATPHAGASVGSAPGQPTGAAAGSPAAQGLLRAGGLGGFTGKPVLAGLASGAIAGLAGSILAGIIQRFIVDPRADGGVFVGLIAAMLGGLVHSWSALNLGNVRLALRRFGVGAAVGIAAGLVAVVAADVMVKAAINTSADDNVALVAYIWALTAALVGLAVGLLRSPKAGAFAFSGGAIAGAVGGFVHGATVAKFERRALVVDGFDGATLVIASFVAMLIGILVALAIRTARSGSLTVIEGPGQGTVIDFHTNEVTIGGNNRDTLVVQGRQLGAKSITLAIGPQGVDVITNVALLLDGQPQPARFVMSSGQVLAFADIFVRLDVRGNAHGGGV